jgi:hypothetical protein
VSRRTVVTLAVVALAAAGTVPATAAKPKPKPITGSYTVTLLPDPSSNVAGETCGIVPGTFHKHAFTAPGAGTLTVDLAAKDSFPDAAPYVDDWDLYIMESGSARNSSTGETGQEHTVDKLKRKTSLVFKVCNLAGTTDAKVTYRFVYA